MIIPAFDASRFRQLEKAASTTSTTIHHTMMAGTILGKRNRDSESSTGKLPNVTKTTTLAPANTYGPDFASISSRVKRRAHVYIHNDEHIHPADTDDVRYTEQRFNSEDVHNSENLPKEPNRRLQRKPINSTQSIRNSRPALSPCKANGQARAPTSFKQSKEDDKVLQLPTPKTPRHRDALSKKIPVTPRHRISLMSQSLTPRLTRTPSTPDSSNKAYEEARQLFSRSADSGQIIGRVKERTKLFNLIFQSVDSKSGNCLYVSGPPGTGKSALVGEVCNQARRMEGVKTAYINCMSIKSSGEVCQNLFEELLGEEQLLGHETLEELQAMFFPKKTTGPVYVVTLDEIDHLLNMDLEILYTLFEWSLQRGSRLIVVGIANALDLTDRFLPRLKARNLKPQLVSFSPYAADDIAKVITTKLQTLVPEYSKSDQVNFVPFVHPAAIQLCSKKVAAQTGDLRKAFDIIHRSIDMIKKETKQKLQCENSLQKLETSPSKSQSLGCLSPFQRQCSSFTDLTALTAPRATIAHVSRIAANAFSNGTAQRLATLNLQQKAALCALISYQKASRRASASIFAIPSKTANARPPTLRRLHETYCGLCRRDKNLHPLTATEFADVIGGLETLGLVSEEGKGASFGRKIGTPSRKGKGVGDTTMEERRMFCFVDEKELEGCLGGIGGDLLKGFLTDDVL